MSSKSYADLSLMARERRNDLLTEVKALEAAFPELSASPMQRGRGRVKGCTFSAEQRARMSESAKARWAAKREKTAVAEQVAAAAEVIATPDYAYAN